MRTPGFGERRFSSTRGVCPIAWTMSPYRPPHGRFWRSGSVTSESVVRDRALRLSDFALIAGANCVEPLPCGRAARPLAPEALALQREGALGARPQAHPARAAGGAGRLAGAGREAADGRHDRAGAHA